MNEDDDLENFEMSPLGFRVAQAVETLFAAGWPIENIAEVFRMDVFTIQTLIAIYSIVLERQDNE